MILKNLEKVGFDPIILEETQNWNKDSGKVFNLNREQVINIPKTFTSFTIGLGWTTECDIDASVLLLNKGGRLQENIFFRNKETWNKSVVHNGDKQKGSGQGGDIETISVNLADIDEDIDSIWPVINIYEAMVQFSDVQDAYCRIYDGTYELVRYNIS